MAVTRKSVEELAQNVRDMHLNRPNEDDLILWPEEYFKAMSKAHRRIYQQIAKVNPKILVTSATFTSADSGATYELANHHFGEMEVYAPPGPPTGARIYPALPDSNYFGWWVDGTTLKFTQSQNYSPLYVRWTPDSVEDLNADSEHLLPAFCEDMLEYETAKLLADKPGIAINPQKYEVKANEEWLGRQSDPSDTGILGIIKRVGASQGIETAAGVGEQPWWRGIK
jgi:hypothetical protein